MEITVGIDLSMGMTNSNFRLDIFRSE